MVKFYCKLIVFFFAFLFKNILYAQTMVVSEGVMISETDMPLFNEGSFSKEIQGTTFNFTPAVNNYVGIDPNVGFDGLYPLNTDSNNGSGTEVTITAPGYSFDLNSFRYLVDEQTTQIQVRLTFVDGTTDTKIYPVSGVAGGSVYLMNSFVTAANDIVSVKLISDHYTTYNNFAIADIRALATNTPPAVSYVSITGTLTIGQTLTGTYTYTDEENNTESGSSFKWYRSDNASGANKTVIAGVTAKTYTLGVSDAGKFISFEVTPKDGTAFGTAVESNRIGPAATAGNVLSSNPIITFTNNSGFADNIASDGEGGSGVISDFEIDILPINGLGIKLTAFDVEYHDAWSGYPPIITYDDNDNGHYGWSIRSKDNTGFNFKGIDVIDWGDWKENTFVIEAFKNNNAVGNITFLGIADDAFVELKEGIQLTSIFKNVDEVRLYRQGGLNSWIALNNIQVGPPVLSTNTPPMASAVTITGTLTIGQTLTGAFAYTDAESNVESGSTFKWYRSDDASGRNKTAIADATAKTYTLVTADAGKYFSFEVIPNDGTLPGIAVESNITGPVIIPNSIIYVNKNITGGTGSGDSWTNAKKELADALKEAKTNTSINEIWVAGGTYKPRYSPEDGANFGTNKGRDNTFLLVNNVKVYGGFAGTETTLAQRDLSIAANTSVLSGDIDNNDGADGAINGNNAYHVVISSGDVGTATLDGFTITGGHANEGGSTITVNGNTIKRNSGGGIYNDSSNPLIEFVTISYNSIVGGDGAGLYNISSSPKIVNSLIHHNGTAFRGGGIYNGKSAPELINVTIADNSISANGSGAGIFNDGGTAIIKNSIIWGNNTTGIQGNASTVSNSIVQGGYSGTHVVNADPEFTNAVNGDYALLPSSPAVNSGNNILFRGLDVNTQDLAGKPRVYNYSSGSSIDLGAYELQAEVIPAVTAVTVPANGYYAASQNLAFTISYSKDVIITGTPQLVLTIGSAPRYADYQSGSNTKNLVFRYSIQSGDEDTDGITVQSLALNGGAIKDAAGNDAELTLNRVGSTVAVLVDAVAPEVASVTSSAANGTYKTGDEISVQMNFSEAVTVTGTPQLALETGNTDRVINYSSGSGTGILTFTYIVQAGDNSADLDYAGTSALSLNGGIVKDAAGNNAILTLPLPGAAGSLGASKNVVVDGIAPTTIVASLALSSDNGISSSDFITNVAAQTISGILSAGLQSGESVYVSIDNGESYQQAEVAVEANTFFLSSITLTGSGTIKVYVDDAAGNRGSLYSQAYVLDTKAPATVVNSLALSNDSGVSSTDFVTNKALQTISGTLNSNLQAEEFLYVSIDNGGSYQKVSTIFGLNVFSLNGALSESSTIIAYVGDAAGNKGTAYSQAYVLDITAPATPSLNLASGSDSGISNTDNITNIATPTFTGTAEAGSIVTLYDTNGTTVLGTASAFGGTWSIASSELSAGTHIITAKTVDAAGNVSGASSGLTVTIDVAPPTLTITSDKSQIKAGETVVIAFIFSEEPGSSFSAEDVLVSGGTLGSLSGVGLTRTATFTPSAGVNSGTATIIVAPDSYSDIAGNRGAAGTSPILMFDTRAPEVVIVSGPPALANSSTATLTFNSDEVGATYQVSTDGSSYRTISSPLILSGLAPGLHTVSVRAIDAAGNITSTPASYTWTVDLTAPEVVSVSVPADAIYKAGDVLTFTVNFDENITVTGTPSLGITMGTDLVDAVYQSGSGNSALVFSYTIATGNTDTDGIVLASAITAGGGSLSDAAGNNALLSLNSVGSTANVLVDAVLPVVNSINRAGASPTNSSSIDYTVTFSESVSGVDAADFTLTSTGSTAGSITSVTPVNGSSYTVTVNSIIGDGTLRLDLNSSGTGIKDAVGNNISKGFTSGQLYTIDRTAPAPPSAPDLVTESDSGTSDSDNITNVFSPTFTGSAEAGSIVSLYDSDGTIVGTAIATGEDWSITSSGLSAGTHNITSRAVDPAGNISSVSSGLALTIDAVAPTLTITSDKSQLKAGEAATITFTFSEDPGFSFSWDGSAGNVTVSGGTLSAVSAIGPIRSAVFTPTVNANRGTASITVDKGTYSDIAGNSGGAGILPSLIYDTQIPAAPVVIAVAHGAAVTVAAPAMSGIAEPGSTVRVYIDGIQAGTTVADGTGNWTYTPSSLTDGSHTIKAEAADAAGNVSVLSSENTFTVSSSPTIYSSGTLAAFNTTYGTASTAQSIYVSGTNLIEGILVTPPSGFEASLDNNHFTSTITIRGSGTIAVTPVYIRLSAGAAAGDSYSGNIILSSSGAVNKTAAVAASTVTAKALTASAAAISKEYDGTTAAVIGFNAFDAAAGLIGTDQVSLTYTSAAYNDKNVDDNKTITINGLALTGTDKINYSLNPFSTTGTIIPKPLTIVAAGNNKVYDGTATASVILSSDKVNSDDISTSFTSAVFNNKNAGTGKAILVSGIHITGNDAGNYTFSTTAITSADISAKPLTIIATGIDKVYDGTVAASVNLSDDKLTSDDISTSYTTAMFDDKNVGTGKTLSVSGISIAGRDSCNYVANTSASTTADITPKALTIKADDKTKFVGTVNPELTVGYEGLVTGEDENVLNIKPVVSTAAITASPIGEYPITVTGASVVNYTISYISGILKVVPGAPTSVSLAAATLYENRPSNTRAGILSSASDDPNAVFTFTLVPGSGDTDNRLFSISGNEIKTASSLNYESKSSYSIRVRSTTQHGFWLEETFTINILDVNEVPTLNVLADQAICYTTSLQTVPLSGITAGEDGGQTAALSVSTDNRELFEVLSIHGSELRYRIKNGLSGTASITVTVKDNGGTANGGTDSFSQNFKIAVAPLPVVSVISDIGTEISKGVEANLIATGGVSYQWLNAHGVIDGQNTATLRIRPAQTTTYRVKVTNASGCITEQEITIKVAENYMVLEANNIMSPNGDGVNDRFKIDNIDMYPNNTVKIYDRAGRLLYSKKNYTDDWDGNFQGAPLAEDTYFYIVDFGTGVRPIKGFVTIVRE